MSLNFEYYVRFTNLETQGEVEVPFTYFNSSWNGYGLTFDIPDLQSFVWQFKELFVDDSYKFVSAAKKPIVIDCGANIGTSCLYFKTLYPDAKITAFEADRNIYEVCVSNLQKNNITDVDVIHKAVWIDDKGIDFSPDGADGGSIQGEGDKNRVPSVRLSTVLMEFNEIDLLKMDVEGAEYDILEGLKGTKNLPQQLLVEFHHRFPGIGKERTADSIAMLRQLGYKIFALSETGLQVTRS